MKEAPDLRRDKHGHYKGCLSSGCGATRCREMVQLVGLPSVDWTWIWKKAGAK